MRLADLIPMLQFSIGPVILISGVALILGSINNRLGRTIDRSRHLAEARNRSTDAQQRAVQDEQLKILWRRAHILQVAITLAVASVLCAALLIISIFVAAVCHLEIAAVVIALFICCLGCMIASLIFFLRDINMSLHALGMEIGATNGNQK